MKKRPIGIEEQKIMNGRCLSCLAENINTNLSETLSTTYQSLLPDEVINPVMEVVSGFCATCENLLRTIHNFREACKLNFEILLKEVTKRLSENQVKQEKIEELEEDVPFELFISYNSDSEPDSENKKLDVDIVKDEVITKTEKFVCTIAALTDFCNICQENIYDWFEHISKVHQEDILDSKKNVKGYKCTECGNIAKDIRLFRKHFGKHIEFLHPVKCFECEMDQFQTFYQFQNHWYKKHNKTKKLRMENLEKVKIREGGEPQLETVVDFCSICSIKVTDWKLHIKTKHSIIEYNGPEKILKCSECKRKMTKPQSYALIKHFRRHIILLEPLKCNGCDRDDFKTFGNYIHHWRNDHSQRRYHCDECSFVTKHELQFKSHFLNQHRGLMYCDHCDEIYTDPELFRYHMQEAEKRKVKICVCDICGAHIRRNLWDHMKYKHSKETPEETPCDVCHKVFKNRKRMLHHKREIHWERRFPCEICGKKFPTSNKVRRHITQVHTEKQYVDCPVCFKKLVTRSLVLHMRNLHPEVTSFQAKNPTLEKKTRAKRCT